jgi:hypothetical protein
MTELIDNGEEVGRRQGGEATLPSANLFHKKVKKRYCDSDEARDREKQSQKIYTRLLTIANWNCKALKAKLFNNNINTSVDHF